jgi:glyoxylase-like metal-dependent hydrolase (beta-lactamase superfamily II)
MSRADEVHEIRPDLFFWQAYEPAVKTDLSCCACLTARGLVFIDPIPLQKEAEAELLAAGAPRAIILTSGNHERASAEFRNRFSVPIYAHAEAGPEFTHSVDHALADGDTVLEEFTVCAIPGAAKGEIALRRGDAVHVGDTLIHCPPYGFGLLPDKYCAEPREMRSALGKLLRFPFDVLTFAHGLPIVAHARQRLAQLLA